MGRLGSAATGSVDVVVEEVDEVDEGGEVAGADVAGTVLRVLFPGAASSPARSQAPATERASSTVPSTVERRGAMGIIGSIDWALRSPYAPGPAFG